MKRAVSSFFCAQIVVGAKNRSWCKKIVVGAERIKYVKNSVDETIKEWDMI